MSNSWGLIISELINDGNTFFSITINPIDNCFDFKTWDERCGFEYDLLKHITKCFPTISFMWFVYEKNKIGKTHIHAVLALKNFIDYNYILKNNLKDCLIKSVRVNGFIVNFKNIYGDDTFYGYNHNTEKYNEGWFVDLVGGVSNNYTFGYDVKVDSLLYFKDIKNWIIYMHKDIRFWNYSVGTSIYYIEEKLFNQIVNELTLLDKYDYYHGGIVTMLSMQYLKCFSTYLTNNSVLKSFFGIKITFNKIDQRTLINVLQYYLILNDYYLYKNNIYVKIKESKISYKLVGGIKEILYDKFQENVVLYFIKNFNNYFRGFDFSYLMDIYFIKNKSIIESIKDISTQRIEPNFGLIEFIDGVYSIKYDRFFSNKKNYRFPNKVCTIKFYNKSYSHVRQNKPNKWINGLKNALGIKKNELISEDYVRLCLHIINPIHKTIFSKNSTLFIHGQSNTGKTTLITNVLSDYYGSENIGSIISSKNFKWQDLVGKIVGIIDEGRYNSSMSSDLLKITGQEKIIIEKKYSKDHIIINPIPLIILSNILFEDKIDSIDKALKNRLYIIEFINIISKDILNESQNYKNNLKDEEANIIIYCNKLLFKLKYDDLNRIGNTISNEKILSKIDLL